MKKSIATILLSVILFPTMVMSQMFFEQDTKYVVWRYVSEGTSYYTYQEVFDDSIVDGTEYYQVVKWVGESKTKVLYKVKDRKVYVIYPIFKTNTDSYHLIYDFNLNAGDSLKVDELLGSGKYKNIYTSTIDSTKTILINGKSKKIQFVTTKLPPYKKHSYIFIEGIGCLETGLIYFEEGGWFESDRWSCKRICMNDSAYLPKLKDNTLNYLTAPCMNDSMRNIVNVDELISNNKILVYPNPVTNQLTVKNVTGNLQLFDVRGTLIREEYLTGQNIMDIGYLPKGIYFLKMDSAEGIKVQRILKL